MGHVAVVVHEASRTGAPAHALAVLPVLRTRGFQLTVVVKLSGPRLADFAATSDHLVVEPRSRSVQRAVYAARFRGWSAGGRSDIRAARRALLEIGADAVHAESAAGLDYAIAGAHLGLRSSVMFHEVGEVLETFVRAAGGAPALSAVTPFANSAFTAGQVSRLLGRPASDVAVMHPAARVAPPPPTATAAAARVVGCGRPSWSKGTDLFVATCERLGVPWAWLGDGGDFRSYLHRHGEAHFPGSVDDPAAWFRSAELVLVPSRQETLSLVAIEALMCGTPVMARAIGGLPEAVGPEGALVDSDDPSVWAAEAEALLGDARRARRVAATGREHVLSAFGEDGLERRLRPLLEHLTSTERQ